MNTPSGDPRRTFGTVLFAPVLIGVLATFVLGSTMMRASGGNSNASRYYSADRNASVAAEKWVVSATADSLKSWVATLRVSGDSLVIKTGADVPSRAAAVADSLLRAEWQAIAPHRENVRVAAVIMLDTARDAAGLKRTHERLPLYAMPWKLDNRTCVAVIRISKTVASEPTLMIRSAISQLYAPASLGACAYVAALGLPGAGARAWMDAVGNARAVRADWWKKGVNANVDALVASNQNTPIVRSNNYLDRLVESRRSPTLGACRSGDETSCALLLEPVVSHAGNGIDGRIDTDLLVPPPGILMPVTREANSAMGAMLSDIITQVGIEKVGAAWRGNEPFINALAQNAKTSASALGATWVRASVPREADASGSVGIAAIAASICAGMLLMGLALVTVRGRERA